MKLSFSTLGCPKLSFRDVLSIAKDLGYDGIELRGIMQTIDAPDLKEFSQENCQQTMERLNKLSLEIPILTSACKLHREEKWEATLALAKRYVDTATKIGTKYVRVLGDSYPAPGGHVSDAVVLEHLRQIADYAAGQGITILIETNGAADCRCRQGKYRGHLGYQPPIPVLRGDARADICQYRQLGAPCACERFGESVREVR